MKQHWAMGSLALATALLAGSGTAQAQAPAQEQPGSETAEPACASLVRAAFPDATTTLSLADLRPPTAAEARGADDRMQGPPAPAMPAHCEVIGKLQERQGANGQTYAIKFHLRLPVQWNGRFVFQGGGGSDGNLGDATGGFSSQPGVTALGQGYAVISSDSGHDNAVNNDPARQGVVTFGHDALARHNYGFGYIGPVVQVGKALIRAYYHRTPAFTYFVGGSKGGQEAMMAVQRFPAEFDAALIGYPGFHLAHASIAQLWDGQAFGSVAKAMGQIGRDGLPLVNKAMSDQDILLAQGAILKACDALDGRTDGMIEHFTACTTARVLPELAKVTCASDNPANKTAACLLPMQVAALRKVMGGPRTHDGQAIYSNWAWDAGIGAQTAKGMTQGWRIWKMGGYGSDTNNGALLRLGAPSNSAVFRSPPLDVASDVTSLTRYALNANIDQAYHDAHVKWGALNEAPVDFMHADATDLSAFTRRGGKIILFHGVSDPVFSVLDTIRWLQAVDRREHGASARFLTFYAVPGMNHGRGGPATDRFDLFSSLVAWREKGVQPGAITATAGEETPWPGRTRLLCPFPQWPHAVAGDPERASSSVCR